MAFNYDNIESEFSKAPLLPETQEQDPDYGFGDLIVDGIQATFPFVQAVKHPMHSSDEAYDVEFDREAWYKEVYPTLPDATRAAVDEMGGARSQAFVDTITTRQEDEQDIQQRMYDYGGLPASIGAQMVGSLLNPVDWAIAAATFGTGKYITTANMVRNVTNKYRKTSAVVAGAIEGAVGGYVSEAVRQNTGGIYDEDARYDVTLFGTVLGGTLGASGWVKFLKEQDTNTAHSILNAMDVDTAATRDALSAPTYSTHKSIGSGAMRWKDTPYDIDDFNNIPVSMRPTQFLSSLSPKGRAYNRKVPTYRRWLEKLTNSDVALENPDGTYHTQSGITASDIKTVDLDGLKGALANDLAASFNGFNTARAEAGVPKLSEKEYGEYLFNQRIEANKIHRTKQAEIDFLTKQDPKANETKIEALKNTELIPTFEDVNIKQANDAIDTYYGEMDARRTEFDRQRRINELEDMEELNIKQKKELSALQSYTTGPSLDYTTRIINKAEFRIDNTTKNKVLASLQNSPTAKAVVNHGTPDEIKEYMDEMVKVAESMVEKIRTSNNVVTLADIMPSGGAAGTLEKGKFSTQRRIDIDENLMGDLLQKDMFGVLDFYHRDTGGRYAIRKAFDGEDITKFDDFLDVYGRDLAEEYDIAGYSPGEVANANADLKRVFNDIRGTADIVDNPDHWFNQTKNGLTALQNIRFGLGFGVTALSELGPTMAIGGVQSLKYLRVGFKEALNKVTNKQVATEFIQELQGMGIGIDLQHSKVVERYVEGRADFESNALINVLRQGENAAFRYGGLTVVTDAMKSMVGGGYTSKIYNIGKGLREGTYKLSAHEEALFSRHGLTVDDLKSIADAPFIFDADDKLINFNMENWEPDLALKVKVAITRAVKGNILEPSAMDLPWDTSNPMHALLFQYLRFPVAATPKLLQRAIAEKDMGAALGAMVSTLVIAGNTYIAGQVAAKVGDVLGITDADGYDDIFNDEDQQKELAKELWHKHPYLGVVPTLVDAGLGLAGEAPLGSDYKRGVAGITGASAGYLYQMGGALGDVVSEPGTLTTGQAHAIKANIPILRLPFLKELSRDYMKEEF